MEQTTSRIARWLKRMKGNLADNVGKAAEGESSGLNGANEVDDRVEASIPDHEGAATPDLPSGEYVEVNSQLSPEHEAMLLK
ncbi:MAG: hypothetical protein CYG60_05250, partial [Actinobacteria bacterium]